MRVALVTNFCPHYRRPLFTELARRVDLTVLFTSRGTEWYWQGERPMTIEGVTTRAMTQPNAIFRELRHGYDAIVTDLTGRASLVATVAAARRAHVPLILWVGIWEHPRTLFHRVSRPFVRRLYRSADAVVTYGRHVSEYVSRESGRTEGIFVAAQAVDPEALEIGCALADARAFQVARGIDPKRRTFVYLGRLAPEKGLEYLLAAASQATEDYGVVIAGGGALLDPLAMRARELGLTQRVNFIGPVDRRELPALFATCDALVLPSISTRRVRETWGLVVNEAMHAGLPVIVTDAVGAAAGDLVLHGRTGLIVPERAAAPLAHALDTLARDGQLRARMAANAREHVRKWSYAAAADGFQAALQASRIDVNPSSRACSPRP